MCLEVARAEFVSVNHFSGQIIMERSRTSSEVWFEAYRAPPNVVQISSWGPLKEDATTSEEFCRIIIEHAGQPRTKDYINDNVGTCNSR